MLWFKLNDDEGDFEGINEYVFAVEVKKLPQRHSGLKTVA